MRQMSPYRIFGNTCTMPRRRARCKLQLFTSDNDQVTFTLKLGYPQCNHAIKRIARRQVGNFIIRPYAFKSIKVAVFRR